MEKLRISYYEATRNDPDYCGYCKCIPCTCDGFGNFAVRDEFVQDASEDDSYDSRGVIHIESDAYRKRSAQRHSARIARGPR